MGFGGRCSGTAPCAVVSGQVEAFFAHLEGIRVEFEGDGDGTVLVGSEACTANCEVLVSPGKPVSVSAIPGPSSLAARATEGCAALPCSLTPPALVRVVFELGRRITTTIEGPGRVDLDAQPWCSTSRCERLVARDAGFTLTAISASDETSFFGFDGGGCSETPCAVDAGAEDVEVGARFASSIVWMRSFEVESGDTRYPTLLADSEGLILTASAGGQVVVDGVVYAAPANADQIFVFAVSVDWLGRTAWVRAFNDYQQIDGNQNAEFEQIIRTDAGVLLGGSCAGGGRFDGLIDCGTLSLLTLSLDSIGRVQGVRADVVPGTFSSAFAGPFAHLQNRIVATQFVLPVRSGTLGFVESGDAGFGPVFTLPGLGADIFQTECVPTAQQTLLCILRREGAFTLDLCTVPAGAPNRNEPVMLEFDGELRCVRGRRLSGGNVLQIGGLSSVSPDGSILFHGANTPMLDLGDGQSVMVAGSFVAEWCNGVVTRLAHQPAVVTGPVQVERWKDGVIAENTFIPGSDVRGKPATTYGVELTFLADDWITPVRRWRFDDLQMSTSSTMASTRFYVEGDRVAIVLEGVDARFAGQPLATTGRRMVHMVVLKP